MAKTLVDAPAIILAEVEALTNGHKLSQVESYSPVNTFSHNS